MLSKLDASGNYIHDATGPLQLGDNGLISARVVGINTNIDEAGNVADRTYAKETRTRLLAQQEVSASTRIQGHVNYNRIDLNGFNSTAPAGYASPTAEVKGVWLENTGAGPVSADNMSSMVADVELYDDVSVTNAIHYDTAAFNGGTGTATNEIALRTNFQLGAANNFVIKNEDATALIDTAGQIKTGEVTYPNVDGVAGQVLLTDGAGNVDFADVSGLQSDSVEFTWTFSSNTTNTDMENQLSTIRFNNAVPASITEIYISGWSSSNNRPDVILENLEIGHIITVQKKQAASNRFYQFVVTSLPVQAGTQDPTPPPWTWYTIGVSVDDAGPSVPNGGDTVGVIFTPIATDALRNVIEDTTPQLGGDLDMRGNNITNTIVDADISITPAGTGSVIIDGNAMPQDAGSVNQVLSTNGSGQTSWVDNVALDTVGRTWQFDTSVTNTDMENQIGYIRFNNSVPSLVTQIYINGWATVGIHDNLLTRLIAGDIIYVQQKSIANRFATFTIDAPPVQAGFEDISPPPWTWYTIDVTVDVQGPAVPDLDSSCSVFFSTTGNPDDGLF
jgi:hypothetical protein